MIDPTKLDIAFSVALARLLTRHPLFDRAVDSAIHHNILGGFWFAASVFMLWIEGARPGGQKIRQRILTILLGSLLAVAFCLIAERLLSWLPPSRYPGLDSYYPAYLTQNVNENSFPSDSTALYSSVAAGILSLNRALGAALLVGVVGLVSLPRLYVGGHYLTDVVAGFLIGPIAYLLARLVFEPSLGPYLERLFERPSWLRVLVELVVFTWISQLAVEFHEAVWIKTSLHYLFE